MIQDNSLNFIKDQVVSIMQATVKIYEESDMLVNFPNHDVLIRQMHQALSNLSRSPVKINPNHKSGQTFKREHHMGTGNVSYAWSIPILDQISKNSTLNLENFKVSDLIQYVSVPDLNKNTLLKAVHNTKPIYVIEYECANEIEKWAVDGNHRIAARYAKNANAEVKGYYFSSSMHMEALIYDYMRVAYAIRTNINRAFGYCVLASDLGYFPSDLPELLSID
jgi:hypothetical protein